MAWMLFNGCLRRWDCFRSGARYELLLSPGINCLHPDVVIVHVVFHQLRQLARERTNELGGDGGFLTRLHRRVYYRLLSALERKIYKSHRVVLIAVSQRTSQQLKIHFGRGDVAVAPNGVDANEFSPEARLARRAEVRAHWHFGEEDFVLLLIGNDWRVKGLPVILEAMAKLRDLPLRLLVAGSDDTRHFQTLAHQERVDDRCRWAAPIVSALDFYAAADIYVSPSLEDSFGLPAAEAMACGLPVITSRRAGIADYIQSGVDGFVLEEPSDSAALAATLKRLQSDAELRHRTGCAATLAARRLTWDRHTQVIENILEEVREPKTGGRASQ